MACARAQTAADRSLEFVLEVECAVEGEDTRAVKQLREQPMLAFQQPKHGCHLGVRQYDRKPPLDARPADLTQPRQVDPQDLGVEEQQGRQRLSRIPRTFMKMTEKLELAKWMREVVVPIVRAKGEHHAAEAFSPANWQMKTSELMLIYAEGALRSPDDRSPSSLLDIWSSNKKVASLSWQPDRPWQPVDVVRLTSGPWLESLKGFVGA